MRRLDLSDLESNLTRFYQEKLNETILEKFPEAKEIEFPVVLFSEFSKSYKTARFFVSVFPVDGVKYQVMLAESYSFTVDWLRSLETYEDVEKHVICYINIDIEFIERIKIEAQKMGFQIA